MGVAGSAGRTGGAGVDAGFTGSRGRTGFAGWVGFTGAEFTFPGSGPFTGGGWSVMDWDEIYTQN